MLLRTYIVCFLCFPYFGCAEDILLSIEVKKNEDVGQQKFSFKFDKQEMVAPPNLNGTLTKALGNNKVVALASLSKAKTLLLTDSNLSFIYDHTEKATDEALTSVSYDDSEQEVEEGDSFQPTAPPRKYAFDAEKPYWEMLVDKSGSKARMRRFIPTEGDTDEEIYRTFEEKNNLFGDELPRPLHVRENHLLLYTNKYLVAHLYTEIDDKLNPKGVSIPPLDPKGNVIMSGAEEHIFGGICNDKGEICFWARTKKVSKLFYYTGRTEYFVKDGKLSNVEVKRIPPTEAGVIQPPDDPSIKVDAQTGEYKTDFRHNFKTVVFELKIDHKEADDMIFTMWINVNKTDRLADFKDGEIELEGPIVGISKDGKKLYVSDN